MPRVINSSDSQENSSPSSNFSPESSESHLSVDRPFGVVGHPIGSSRLTALLGMVDCSLGGSRLPPEKQSVDYSLWVWQACLALYLLRRRGVHAKRRKTATKAKRAVGDKNALVFAGRAMEDDHIDLTRGADPTHAEDDHTVGDSPVLDLRFSPAHARRDMEVMRNCVISHMSEGLLRRQIEDIEKVLAVYNRNVLTLEDSLVKACKRMVTDLEVVEDEKSKEIHHLKKKNSSLRKSCEASEARVKEREEEIDNLQFALARAQHDTVENLEQAAEQGQAAKQDGVDDQPDYPLQGEDGASQLD
ncbi:Uncharacterized protein Fot_05747 [Forsythia ovata]|uniref:Uncharacterized protein n=1 Tax=Forsythia ovata TaxID=205694 RepID=A0ABD1WTU3_9LAMI